MKEGYILALDQGTTGTKVIVFDHAGRVRSRAYAEFTQHFPQAGWVEHDADEILRSCQELMAQALREAGAQPCEIRAIGITNQRETVVLWDKRTGRPVCRAVVWQDRRTAALCDELKARGMAELFRAKTGLVVDPYFSGTKIAWINFFAIELSQLIASLLSLKDECWETKMKSIAPP